eukprot:TRINITY_DN1630_c3_g4_i1.p1 TRINITY_DN1630_c3_g4~~TRINITY_DN1630_c3_g4_i1.p1  ORF type:complete len:345 (-),score=72.19 TRINITY_DN1630_c3_g4_i1:69-1082(-)
MKSLKIIVLGIIAAEHPPAFNETKAGEQLVKGLLKILGDDGASAYAHSLQIAAVELLGRTFSVWSSSMKLEETIGVIAKLFALLSNPTISPSASSTSGNPSLKTVAQQSLLLIGGQQPSVLISFLIEEVLKKNFTVPQHASAMSVISSLIKKTPAAMIDQIGRLIEAIIRCLDPTDLSKREKVLKSTTSVLHAFVKRYPFISFDLAYQRLAVGSGKLVSIYDLKTATKWALLKGHESMVCAAEFSSDGNLLATYSCDDSKIICWQTSSSSSFWKSLSSSTTTPRIVATFEIPSKSKPKANSSNQASLLLDGVKISWSTPRSISVSRSWDPTTITLQL